MDLPEYISKEGVPVWHTLINEMFLAIVVLVCFLCFLFQYDSPCHDTAVADSFSHQIYASLMCVYSFAGEVEVFQPLLPHNVWRTANTVW